MPALDEPLALEEGLWRAAGSRDAYAAHLADDAVHVVPGWGATDDNERRARGGRVGGAVGEVLDREADARRARRGRRRARLPARRRRLVVHQQTPL